jgi:fibronectin type 3 domain-containing protein
MKKYGAILIVLITSSSLQAQDSLRVSVIANIRQGVVQLRWGVNTPLAWKQTNRYGFKLERFTVMRNNEVLPTAERTVLAEVIKPQPLDNWKDLATQNNYAAIIAQALYGEKFQLTGNDTKGVSKFIALAQEMEQRYMVAMYAAELCYPAAVMAGWGYEDKNVKRGERYLYRVTPLTPENVIRIANGSAYISLKDMQPLPQPQELAAVFGDKTVLLTWNYGLLKNTYVSYFVEKSLDGKIFNRLTKLPLANMNAHEGKPSNRMFYIDSLKNNSLITHYRIIGVTSFSEEGPASDTVKGQGVYKLIYIPHITRSIPNTAGGIEIEWEFDERGNTELKHFELQWSNNHNGPFVSVKSGIQPGLRKTVYDSLRETNYFAIKAVPMQGEGTVSFPVLVQPSDSIPPAPPTGLIGVIDTLGVVKLSWNKNLEKDLLGYQIYRAQTKGEELIPLTSVAIRTNQFVDTINVRNLNTKVYYAVTAVDRRYNQSNKSAVTEIIKPELVPPSTPVFTQYEVTPKGILLGWETGQEENLGKICLFRREQGSKENKLIKTFIDLNTRSFVDSTVSVNQMYSYQLTTVTAKGLSSPPSPSISIQTNSKTRTTGNIVSFTAKVNRKEKLVDVVWEHDLTDVKGFELYKGETGKPVSLWRVTKGFEKQVKDKDVKPGTQYDYIIRALMVGGKSGTSAKTSIAVK